MIVSIKDLGVSMEIKNRGLEIDVKDTKGDHLGDFYITGTKLIWCRGKTSRENGVEITWANFIRFMEEDD
jgi:hypothetical protein